MQSYQLTLQAEEDIKGIARYTLEQWGNAQSTHYAEILERHFEGISRGGVHSRSFSDCYPQIKVSHCEHHYIFYVHLGDKSPIIIAVLHERMDLLVQLQNRLG